uniref:Transcription factor domain-containing protein n=1 Tax=Bionectria ochroleuca TaxID=29856 RepID=A0A8H7NMJ5_BIOOC
MSSTSAPTSAYATYGTRPSPSHSAPGGSSARSPASITSVSTNSSAHTVATAPLPITSPPLTHQLSSQGQTEQFLMFHYNTNLAVPGMAPIINPDDFQSINSSILYYANTPPLRSPCPPLVLCPSSCVYPCGFRACAWILSRVGPAPQGGGPRALPAGAQFGGDPESGNPLLTACTIFIACAFTLPAADPDYRTGYDRIELLAQVSGLYQGATALFRMGIYGPYPQQHEMAAANVTLDFPWQELEASLQVTLRTAESIRPRSEQEDSRKAVLIHAGQKLLKSLHLAFGPKRNYHAFCIWLGVVKPGFVDLMYARDPFALSLVAHWAICHRHLNTMWWARGWPSAAVRTMYDATDYDHRYLLDWCMSRVEMDESYAAVQPSPFAQRPGPFSPRGF